MLGNNSPYLKRWALPASGLLLLVIGYIDFRTGYELGFFVFYFLPIMLAAWFAGRTPGIFVAILCAIAWHISDIFSHQPYSQDFYRYWNASIRLIAFLTIAFIVAQMRNILREEKKLSRQLSMTLKQIKQLKGLLPICASCKKIRNDTGYWEQIETYIETHTDADFSHGICPDCMKKLYDINPSDLL